MSVLNYRPPRRRVKEASIQEKVVAYARETFRDRLVAIKRQSGKFGTNGWPDYEFLIKGGQCFHVEFKRPGGHCTDLQLQRHATLRALGHRVYVCDDAVIGKSIIEDEIRRNPCE